MRLQSVEGLITPLKSGSAPDPKYYSLVSIAKTPIPGGYRISIREKKLEKFKKKL